MPVHRIACRKFCSGSYYFEAIKYENGCPKWTLFLGVLSFLKQQKPTELTKLLTVVILLEFYYKVSSSLNELIFVRETESSQQTELVNILNIDSVYHVVIHLCYYLKLGSKRNSPTFLLLNKVEIPK